MNVINHNSIVEAIKELSNLGKTEIVNKLQNILDSSEISKPELHNRKDDKLTSFYKVHLSKNDLEQINDAFLNLEVESLTNNGEAGNLTERYVSLLDEWSKIYGSNNNSASL